MQKQSEQQSTGLNRSMQEMLRTLERQRFSLESATRTAEGLCRLLSSGAGFRFDYHDNVAKGGWEFYELQTGLCLATVDMVPARVLPRRHSAADFLALSAVLDGNIPLTDESGTEGELAGGYCTVYGAPASQELETIYRPDEHLRWVTVYLDRQALLPLTGLSAADLPDDIMEFLDKGGSLHCRNVPLSHPASLAAHQILRPPFEEGFRHAFLRAKSMELACHILFNLSRRLDEEEAGCFSIDEHRKLQAAMRLIQTRLDQPFSVAELGHAVGLSKHRLQIGFRMVYGDTVCRIRDKIRMELALDLIRDSSMTMLEIALETGYHHPASFTRAFKSAFGISPMQMRNATNDEYRLKSSQMIPDGLTAGSD